MKNFWTILSVVLVVAVLLLSSVLYQVRATETVIIKRFGKVIRTVDEPGLNVKFPQPIDVVVRFDKRSRLFDDIPEEETTTAGGEPIIVKSYTVWAIEDPEKFMVSVKDVDNAKNTLRTLLRNAQNSVIGKHYFSEFVNTNPDKIQYNQIEEEFTTEIRQKANDEYGIAIRTVGIKQINVSKNVTEKVFDRMKADRVRKTKLILAEGEARAKQIESDANAMQKELLAIARSQAQAIRGAGDAEAARYYEMLKEDPELAILLRNLEALKKILAERTTIILGVDTEPMKLLKEMPSIEPNAAFGTEK